MALTRLPSAVKSISAIRPSWDSGGQQAAVWLETRLPSPKTTGLPLTQRIGCTTCTCWPTIAVIAGERVSLPASAACAGEMAWLNSVPQWRLTITARAPRAPGLRAPRPRIRPGVGPVEAPRVGHRLAVGDGGEGEEGDLHALHLDDRRTARSRSASAPCRRASRPARSSAAQRCADPVLPGVERVVRGGAAGVPADRSHRPREPGRRAEARIALHGAGHERRLHVAEGQVRARRCERRIDANIGLKS